MLQVGSGHEFKKKNPLHDPYTNGFERVGLDLIQILKQIRTKLIGSGWVHGLPVPVNTPRYV